MKKILTEKEIIDLLEKSKEELYRSNNDFTKYYDKGQFDSPEFNNSRKEFYKCINKELEKIANIVDNMKNSIRAGYHSPICRVAQFLEEIKKLFDDNKLEDIKIKAH